MIRRKDGTVLSSNETRLALSQCTSLQSGSEQKDDARALMTVSGGRTVHELRGISCLPLDLVEPTRKGIAVTRSFGAPVTSWTEMREALASYTTRAAEKMRRYMVAADNLFVFMHISTFNQDPLTRTGLRRGFAATTNDTAKWWRWPCAWASGYSVTASATRSAA